jgi:hypothetical protein
VLSTSLALSESGPSYVAYPAASRTMNSPRVGILVNMQSKTDTATAFWVIGFLGSFLPPCPLMAQRLTCWLE